MIEFSLLWLSWWVDITCKALLLGAIAGLAIFAFRLRDANVRHRVWTTVLCGMCGLPLLVLVTPRVPLPGWLQLPPAVLSVELAHLNEVARLPDDSNLNILNSESPEANVGWPDEDLRTQRFEPLQEEAMYSDGASAETVSAAASTAGRSNRLIDPSAPLARAQGSWVVLALAAVLVQVTVSMFLLVRVAVGLLLSRRIIARAIPINGFAQSIPKNIQLVQSNELSVPATIGFLRPHVLLPCSWNQWQPEKIRSVLLHELAHVRRADWLVNFLSEVNCALHWFNPLAWITRKQLADLAELNCDDAVLEARGDRAVYATHLIEVAAELASAGRKYHPPRQSIAMARRALVEVRIDAILDDSRRLARRLGHAGMVALMLLVVPIILLAAALGPNAGKEALAQNLISPGQTVGLGDVHLVKPSPTPKGDSQSSLPSGKDDGKGSGKTKSPVATVGIQAGEKSAAQNVVAAVDHTLTVSGRVVDATGKPISGAKLYWPQATTSRNLSVDQVATTDDDGQFQTDLTIPSDRKQLPQPHLVAAADGHGVAWADFTNWVDAPSQSLAQEVRIVLPEEFPVSLRVIDTEGRPLKGVVPQIFWIAHDPSGSLDKLLNAWLVDNRFATQTLVQNSFAAGTVFSLPPSDDDGRLVLRGLGLEQVATLVLMSPQIANAQLTLLTRPGFVSDMYNETAIAQSLKTGTPVRNLERLVGSGEQLVLEPGRSVYGIVTDARTGLPIEGVRVESYSSNRSHAEVKTNRLGEYRLNGLSSVDKIISITARKPNLGYLVFSDSVRQTDDLQPIHFDFKLQPGVVITGNVSERESGRPISGNIWLVPLPENHWKENPAFASYQSRQNSGVDQHGNFTLIGVPGAHVIMMQASSELIDGEYIRPYRKGSFSAADQSRVRIHEGGEVFYSSTTGLEAFEDAMKVIDIPEGATEYSVDLLIERGMEVDVDLQDEQGSPLSGTYVGGISENAPTVIAATDSTVRIYSLEPSVPRRVLFFHQERKLTGEITLRGDEQERPIVRLTPSHQIAGKAVDAEGLPISKARVTLLWADDTADQLQRQFHQQYPQEITDDEGNFKVGAPFPSKLRLLFTVNNQVYRAKDLIDTEQFPPIAPQEESVVELGEILAAVKAR